MMRVAIHDAYVQLWLSARDTSDWATRPGASWPCSQLRGKRLFAAFAPTGLVEITINGRDNADCGVSEFNAITSDHLAQKLPKEHPAWFITVGQFQRD